MTAKAMNLGIFIIPYKEFNPDCNARQEFTCGNTGNDSLPETLQEQVKGWDAVLKNFLSQLVNSRLAQKEDTNYFSRL